MSTDENTEAAGLFTATLVRGRFYSVAGKEFLKDEPQTVDAGLRAYLEDTAFDEVTIEGEGEVQQRPKFKFEPFDPNAPKAAAKPSGTTTRIRTRSNAG